MIRKKIVQKMSLLTGTACLALTILASPFVALPVQASAGTESTIQSSDDCLIFYYRVKDGKIYKRLYNVCTGQWIGDWIYVGKYTG